MLSEKEFMEECHEGAWGVADVKTKVAVLQQKVLL
jgi:hypothetical protein